MKQKFKNCNLPPAAVLSWLVTQRNLASIEDVTDELLRSIVEDNEFVAVFFRLAALLIIFKTSVSKGWIKVEQCQTKIAH